MMERTERYHSLDGLRAAMMLLGLVLHSAASYTASRHGHVWPYQDRSNTAWLDLALIYIHLFRMPIFFVMSGFFTALIFHERGVASLLRIRGQRVLVPLVLFWIVLFPLTTAGFEFARRSRGDAVAQQSPSLSHAALGFDLNLMHLWFLYHLLIFGAAALLLVPLFRRIPSRLRERASAVFTSLISSPWGPAVFAVATLVTLYPMSRPWIDTSVSLTPPLRILIAYGVFFAFGWLLFVRRDRVNAFSARVFRHLALGALATLGLIFVLLRLRSLDPALWHLLGIAAASLAIWFQVFGITGFFVRYLGRPTYTARYLADASYWMYLVHVPLVVWTAAMLADVSLPAGIKLASVLGLTVIGCLLSYHYLVRSTAVGVLLNGRRYPRKSSPVDRPEIVAQRVSGAEPVEFMNPSART